MKPYTVERIVGSIVAAAACAMILLTINTCSSISAKAAEPCKLTEEQAISMVPPKTVVLYGSKRAFTILHDRYNTQRQSIGYGPVKADRIVVMLFFDTSVAVFQSYKGCYLRETSAHLKLDNWKGVMEDLKLTPRDFTPSKLPSKGIEL